MFSSLSYDSLVSAAIESTDCKPFVIGIAGGSASGKSKFCELIQCKLNNEFNVPKDAILVLNASNFYKSLSEDKIKLALTGMYNFDHPFAFDIDLLQKTLQCLIIGQRTKLYQYNFNTFQQECIGYCEDYPSIILIEGILVLYFDELRPLFSMKVFLDVDSDTRLSNTVMRDTVDGKLRRTKLIDQVLDEWLNNVKPSFEDYVLPSKKHADVVVPRGLDNTVAIDLIVQHIYDLFRSGQVGSKRKLFGNASGSLNKIAEETEESPTSPRMEMFSFDNGESIYKPVPE